MREDLEKLAWTELDRANTKFPQFASRHEGHSVLTEEIEEAEEFLMSLNDDMSLLWEIVRGFEPMASKSTLVADMYGNAISLAAEAIQIAAMALKFQNMEGMIK